jgi:four helix bundle protein
MNRIPSFKDLEVWRRAMGLVRRVYEVTRTYPGGERFGLVAETRKTVRSVPANIAEGKTRVGGREFHHFMSVALGSLGELQTQVLMARELGYLDDLVLASLEREIEEISRMSRALERALA